MNHYLATATKTRQTTTPEIAAVEVVPGYWIATADGQQRGKAYRNRGMAIMQMRNRHSR